VPYLFSRSKVYVLYVFYVFYANAFTMVGLPPHINSHPYGESYLTGVGPMPMPVTEALH